MNTPIAHLIGWLAVACLLIVPADALAQRGKGKGKGRGGGWGAKQGGSAQGAGMFQGNSPLGSGSSSCMASRSKEAILPLWLSLLDSWEPTVGPHPSGVRSRR